MSAYADHRASMILGQVRTNDVQDRAIIDAMAETPRELFVPADKAHLAYADLCVEVKKGRFLLDPRTLAKLLQLASLRASDRVLDVACATGYSTAVLARVCEDVVALEEDGDLAAQAGRTLSGMPKSGRLICVAGAHAAGCPDHSPYDVIVVNGAIDTPPSAWLGQLKPGGRLVSIVRQGPHGRARLFVREGDVLSGRDAFDASVPHLPGFEPKSAFSF